MSLAAQSKLERTTTKSKIIVVDSFATQLWNYVTFPELLASSVCSGNFWLFRYLYAGSLEAESHRSKKENIIDEDLHKVKEKPNFSTSIESIGWCVFEVDKYNVQEQK